MKQIKRIKLPDQLFISLDRISIGGKPEINIGVRFTADDRKVKKLASILMKKLGIKEPSSDVRGFFLSEDDASSGVTVHTGLIILPLNASLSEIAHEAAHAGWYIADKKMTAKQFCGENRSRDIQECLALHTGQITSIVRCIQDAVFFNHELKGRLASA